MVITWDSVLMPGMDLRYAGLVPSTALRGINHQRTWKIRVSLWCTLSAPPYILTLTDTWTLCSFPWVSLWPQTLYLPLPILTLHFHSPPHSNPLCLLGSGGFSSQYESHLPLASSSGSLFCLHFQPSHQRKGLDMVAFFHMILQGTGGYAEQNSQSIHPGRPYSWELCNPKQIATS